MTLYCYPLNYHKLNLCTHAIKSILVNSFGQKNNFFVFLIGPHAIAEYDETSGNIERLHKFLFFALSMTVLLVFFTAAPYSFVRYYIFDMGPDSFYLFAPSWSVLIYVQQNKPMSGFICFLF